MREVYINGKQVDVNQDDAVDIIYESPIFSDISKIKSNTTTTYTLPKTERNLAIFHHADQHDVVNSLAYSELTFEEYRNGLPIIQNGRCRLLKIAERIELAVVWGTKVAISEKLNLKLTELADGNDSYSVYDDCCVATDGFMGVNENKEIGFLYAAYGTGFSSDTSFWKVPSVTVRKILSIIEKLCGVEIDFKKKEGDPKADIEKLLKERWITFAGNKTNDDDDEDNKGKRIVHFNVEGIDYNKQHDDIIFKAEGKDGDYLDTDLLVTGTGFGERFFKAFYIPNENTWIDLIFSVVFNWDSSNTKIRIGLVYYKNSGQGEVVKIMGEYYPSFNAEKGKAYLDIRVTHLFENLGTNFYPGQKGHKYDIRLYKVDANGKNTPLYFRQENEGHDVNMRAAGRIVVSSKTGQQNLIYPMVPNLPDMTCIDFIKSICQMYALFPHFNFKTNKLEFLQIDDIYDNKKNAKNWDDKVIAEPWSIERTFGDYAQRNILSYQDDDTVSTVSRGAILVENSTLSKEKELAQLKFSATDTELKWINLWKWEYTYIAKLPYYNKKDDGFVEYQSLKPRILNQGDIEIEDGLFTKKCKSLTFDHFMKFEGEKGKKHEGLIEKYYRGYQKVVRRAVVRDVTILLSDVELMKMSALDVIYLRGKYWMPIKVQVGVDGKAKARLILLPDA